MLKEKRKKYKEKQNQDHMKEYFQVKRKEK